MCKTVTGDANYDRVDIAETIIRLATEHLKDIKDENL
jgi:hypothetical protein